MKINLLLDNTADVRSGYLNIDPFAADVDDPAGRKKGDIASLDGYVDHGEAEEIVAYDILNYFSIVDVDTCLKNWLACLAHGGQLTVSVIDLTEVARALLANTLSLDAANDLLHGEQREPWEFRRCSLTMAVLVQTLETYGFKILKKRVTNHRAYVTCERP